MTDLKLLKSIGEIDDRFIDEAAEYMSAAQNRRRRSARRAALLAACLAVAVGVVALVKPPESKASNDLGQKDALSQNIAKNDSVPGNKGLVLRNDSALTSDDAMLEESSGTKKNENANVDKLHDTAEQSYPSSNPSKVRHDSGKGFVLVEDPVRSLWYITIKRSMK